MATSLVDQLISSLGPDGIRMIGQQLGVDEQTAQTSVGLGIPVLLSALANNAERPEGAAALTTALTKDHDGSIFDNVLGALLGGAQPSNPAAQDSDKILGHVLGDQRSRVESSISQSSGIDGGKLLLLLAPLVLGALGSQQRQQGLDADGVAGSLRKERRQLEEQNSDMMGGISSMLDSNKDGSIIDEVLGMLGRVFGGRR